MWLVPKIIFLVIITVILNDHVRVMDAPILFSLFVKLTNVIRSYFHGSVDFRCQSFTIFPSIWTLYLFKPFNRVIMSSTRLNHTSWLFMCFNHITMGLSYFDQVIIKVLLFFIWTKLHPIYFVLGHGFEVILTSIEVFVDLSFYYLWVVGGIVE